MHDNLVVRVISSLGNKYLSSLGRDEKCPQVVSVMQIKVKE